MVIYNVNRSFGGSVARYKIRKIKNMDYMFLEQIICKGKGRFPKLKVLRKKTTQLTEWISRVH